jgi:V8-like Glu-specific endopeptidase
MRHSFIISAVVVLSAAFSFTSCKDDKSSDPAPAPAGRAVKYEITGNYTGHVTVVYADQDGSYETIVVNSLPWTISFTADPGTPAAGFTATGTSGKPGVKGQTATAKIYINGAVVKTSNSTANDDGYIMPLNPGSYAF